MQSLQKLITEFYLDENKLRLGQYFCNHYIKEPWPELYYADDIMSTHLIRKWLENNQYYVILPPKVNENAN